MDLQENVKAQENLAYALKVKISNLQKMAETLVWVQENNINDLTELNDLCKTAQANAQAAYERLSQAEDELYKTNEQIPEGPCQSYEVDRGRNELAAEKVQSIFRWKISGMSNQGIADRLNAKRCRPRLHESCRAVQS